ncbi:hypothetical protein [Brevifollis gellanilyticus]|uniref:Uncharacterized protein n=1 Tax=Brevifollis gellanilyticus TaxID=748831 RepID=A0A512MGD0_9BACT|nr:hypothetical protein [Brevifollis gellanilyticus]GEP45800.1 hypothetical protein BGE01nite_50910 [Brevifollis gellanilyticus]
MEPLSPNDPLWNLLGKTKKAEPRPNFVQNVVRAARQTPQDRGMLSWFKGWWQDQEHGHVTVVWAAVAAVIMAGLVFTLPSENAEPQVAVQPVPVVQEPAVTEGDFLVPEFETQWENLTQMGDLVAVQDTSELTDSEIRMLLY